MDASILLIGDANFRFSLLNWVREAANLTVESAADPFEAMPLILAQQPDIVLVQASQPNYLELCRQLKAQSQLAWIYCIVLDEQSGLADPAGTGDQAISIQQEVAALDAGADAFVQLPPTSLLKSAPNFQQRFQAHMRVGLRQVQTHRDLMRTNDVLSAIALSDPLTSLNNRRAFEWELPRQIQNARSRSIPISLIMLDVDFLSLSTTPTVIWRAIRF